MMQRTCPVLRCPGLSSRSERAAQTQPAMPSGSEKKNDRPSESTSRPRLETAHTVAAMASHWSLRGRCSATNTGSGWRAAGGRSAAVAAVRGCWAPAAAASLRAARAGRPWPDCGKRDLWPSRARRRSMLRHGGSGANPQRGVRPRLSGLRVLRRELVRRAQAGLRGGVRGAVRAPLAARLPGGLARRPRRGRRRGHRAGGVHRRARRARPLRPSAPVRPLADAGSSSTARSTTRARGGCAPVPTPGRRRHRPAGARGLVGASSSRALAAAAGRPARGRW